MKLPYTLIYPSCFIFACTAFALDEFHVQANKIGHEETSWRHDIYTTGESMDLWASGQQWFQQPAVTLRLNAGHHERDRFFFSPGGESYVWTPMLSGSFRTVGGINVGVTYGHSIHSVEVDSWDRFEGNLDSVGGYVSKQWDCGVNVVGTASYTRAHEDPLFFRDLETLGVSGGLGFARSFGEKTFGRNIFVDTSANFLYEDDNLLKEAWHFVWLFKVGHSFTSRFSAYALLNLFHELDRESSWYDFNPRNYHPVGDETWGEAGGGLQAQLGDGFALSAEAATPVLDEGIIAEEAVQLRAALNWRF